jgi:hypothetical protein
MIIEIIITATIIIGLIALLILGQLYFFELMLITALLGGYSYFIERNSLETTRPEIKLNNLSADIKGKIALISDLHFNAKTSENQINKLFYALKESNPEVVFIVGDLIDKKDGIKVVGSFVKRITAFTKVYIVFGNWDYFALKYNINDLKKELESNGAKVLMNESEIIKIGDSDFNLVGIKAPYVGQNIKNDLAKSMAGIKNNNLCKILLTHSPESINEAALKNIDLVLAGHTHGGQIYVPFLTRLVIPTKFAFKKYIKGIYKVGDTTLYVNRGIGTSNLPFRFLNLPELTILSLTHNK